VAAPWEPETPEIDALRSFVEREHEAHQRGREAAYDRPVEERVASGTAVADVRFAGVDNDGRREMLIFRCPRNDSRFRPGTRLRLSRGDSRRCAGHLELIDDRFEGGEYIFRLAGVLEDPDVLDDPGPWVLDEDVFDLLDVQLAILRDAEEAGLADWLAGTELPPVQKPEPAESFFADGLEGTMRAAFDGALRSSRWFAVQGPPGSGKTHLLARLALHFALEENCRVLVTAVSHQAIHQALGETYWTWRLMAEDEDRGAPLDGGFYKLGASRGANEGLPAGVHPVFRLPAKKRPIIAGATIYAAMNMVRTGGPLFDVVLFDEAGQAPLVLALGARLLAPETVFLGDDAQLPPVIELPPEEEASALARASTLELIRDKYGDPLMLDRTRRLNAELCEAVSDAFYGSALQPTAEAESRRLRLSAEPVPPFDEMLRPDRSLVFVDIPHEDSRSSSEAEAVWAAAAAAEAVRCGIPADEVGVIAPYRAQCNRIRFLLGRPQKVVCATVERFQGQERELVIISLTSSSLRYIARLAAFLFNPNRLNVAISRARSKVILLGARKALLAACTAAEDEGGDAEEAARGLRVFRGLLERAHPVETRGRPPGARVNPSGGKEAP